MPAFSRRVPSAKIRTWQEPPGKAAAGEIARPTSSRTPEETVMGMTLAEKILARASGREQVSPDQIVVARVDLAMSHENADLVRKSFLEIGLARVWDPSRIVIVFDHRIPAESEKTATTHKAVREFVAAQSIEHFY